MKDSNNRFSRTDLQKKKKTDRYLNILIGIVVVAIIVSAAVIFSPKDSTKEEEDSPNSEQSSENERDEPQENKQDDDNLPVEDGQENSEIDEALDEDLNDENPDALDREVIEDVDDPVVEQTIIDHNWQPIGTTQQGEHVSVYDKSSVDWQEKIRAIEYATGLVEDNMTVWRLQNGGSPQKSIGIVSTKNQDEKYRVYLEWIDGEGWMPEKMDILNTVDFNY